MKPVFAFVGCSGSGKTTLGEYISGKFDIEYREVSARPFLTECNKSYDEQMTDEMQTRIMYGNMETVYEAILDANLNNKNILLSRSCIDVLAYARSLNKGNCCEDLQEKTIKKLRGKLIILYTIPDFPMNDPNDKQRGMNEEIRNKTDEKICEILSNLNIPYYIIRGNLNERKIICEEIMTSHNILRKK